MRRRLLKMKKPTVLKLSTGEHFFVAPLGKGGGKFQTTDPVVVTCSKGKGMAGKMKGKKVYR